MSDRVKDLEDKYLKKNQPEEEPKHKSKLVALDYLSLGISIVASVIIGTFFGIFLKNMTGYNWFLFVGIFWGIMAAILNIYRAYKRAQKEYEGMENDPRYAYRAKYGDVKEEEYGN